MLRKIDADLDLSTKQIATARERLGRCLEAHRRREMAEYPYFLGCTRSLVADGLSPREAEWIVRQRQTLVQTALARNLPDIVVPMSDLSEVQIQYLQVHFETVNGNYRRTYLSPSEGDRFGRRVQRTTRHIEDWTGQLSENQRQRVAELRRAFSEITKDRLSYNIGQQQRLLALLKHGASAQPWTDFLISWWFALEERDPPLERKTDEALEALTRLMV